MNKVFKVICAVFLSLIVSCGSSNGKEETIRRLIGRYNVALVHAYKEGRFDDLREIAADRAFGMVENTYLSYLRGIGVLLDSELLGMELVKMELGSGEDEAKIVAEWSEKEKEWREVYVYKESDIETEERWRYKWIDGKTGEAASPVITVKYRMRYTVDKVDGKLMVISSVIIKETVEKTEGDSDRWKNAYQAKH
ncbi:MAG: hypothetical protein A3G39_07800 [Deltaproteobacteria bacterium RIFCSPLOWO2_12_FULL_43_16]|nr:MAG: hypothetical protein A2Z89_05595 [Deltaproteobacteria bacterium GWA2_43_19]OGQ12117.1 MAG: hypothetical protein A3D30_07205 [Deltaproteobacteria bacterium RIFCSPHIGHO2_02_FULL_43_33]OGQ61523.1 MAG: hypothetical protein A3G39_07800 [Deltaproteobacteria bacterium RIFCSPLOWO2_12_FULL_43_16]HBR16142.1 hypothetical protein [Deltaproteobacteria bacterium]